jgi:hypothetical protein
MTKKNKAKRKEQEKPVQSELKDEQLDKVSGGATFLRGSIVQAQPATATLGGQGGGGQLAANSATTLECWETCTIYISGCGS